MGLKSDFIESIRHTPDGIAAFLTTAIPTLEATTKPTTVDDANITNGILAHNLNVIFKSLEGLTPVELLLRIGQHSNVAEAMLLSGLEYLEESETEKSFLIKEPIEGTKYAQGDVRIIVEAKNGTISTVTILAHGPDGTPFDITLSSDEIGTTFYGYLAGRVGGVYNLDFTVIFNDATKTTQTASLTITVGESGEDTTNPEGEDLTAFNTALDVLDKYYQEAIKGASSSDPVTSDEIKKFYASVKILAGLAFSLTAKKVIQIPVDIIQAVIDEVEVLKS